ncbi:hypothetical protein PanWU01x14_028870 [Parasponia andersonii]|uniref:Uncharacterized protein n=1 Tax=Parasponia andersonii TaxID=3476 RepID=A0A2P5DVG2_PARAD|nr:hypothetical protein PanWU01x14_028870 [Parasponia andersonii]
MLYRARNVRGRPSPWTFQTKAFMAIGHPEHQGSPLAPVIELLSPALTYTHSRLGRGWVLEFGLSTCMNVGTLDGYAAVSGICLRGELFDALSAVPAVQSSTYYMFIAAK